MKGVWILSNLSFEVVTLIKLMPADITCSWDLDKRAWPILFPLCLIDEKPTEPQLFACFLNNSVCMNRKLTNVFQKDFYNKFTMVIKQHVLTRWDAKSVQQKAICLLKTTVQGDTITFNHKIFVVLVSWSKNVRHCSL